MKRALKEAIILTASYYDRTLNGAVLEMYVEDLEDLPIGEVIAAYRNWRKNPANRVFPLPAQIRAIVRPEVDHEAAAREIAARIQGAIVKHGHPNSQLAKADIGEVGWSIVQRMGGWDHLCKQLGVTIQPSAFYAQVRDLAVAGLKYTPSAMAHAIGSRVKAGELQSAGDILGHLTGHVEGT